MSRLVCWHRLWLASCWRCRTVAYLDEIIEADRSRTAARHLDLALSNLPAATGLSVGTATPAEPQWADVPVRGGTYLPDGPCRQRPRPEPALLGSPSAPVRVIDLTDADVAHNP